MQLLSRPALPEDLNLSNGFKQGALQPAFTNRQLQKPLG
jgi:hypothetical protein